MPSTRRRGGSARRSTRRRSGATCDGPGRQPRACACSPPGSPASSFIQRLRRSARATAIRTRDDERRSGPRTAIGEGPFAAGRVAIALTQRRLTVFEARSAPRSPCGGSTPLVSSFFSRRSRSSPTDGRRSGRAARSMAAASSRSRKNAAIARNCRKFRRFCARVRKGARREAAPRREGDQP